MSSHVELKNVSLRFRRYQGMSSGLKDTAMAALKRAIGTGAKMPGKSEFWGLRHVDLSLREGDRLGIIGHNGAGKSTLLKVISRIYKPTEGSVAVQGRIAPLIEIGAGFNPELSGRENAYLNGAILGMSRKVIAERMDSIIAFSELADFIDTPLKYYSTGMYLRLAFTLATEVAPDILILDELYAGGDVGFIQKANVRLDSFVNRSKILILVAHNMDYIRRFCNRAIVLQRGQIIASGEPNDVIARYLESVGVAAPVGPPGKESNAVPPV